MRHLILTIVATLLAVVFYRPEAAPLGFLAGLMGAELLRLRDRVATLEKERLPEQQREKERVSSRSAKAGGDSPSPQVEEPVTESSPYIFTPVTDEAGPKKSGLETFVDRIFGSLGDHAGSVRDSILRFFRGGNLVLKIGILVLFCGVGFLLKYAAQRNMIPPELRLIASAVGAVALLFTGWKLRHKKGTYGLTLQGGGVGILYLTIFAAARIYTFLPLPLAFALMVCIVVLSGVLAVMQDSRGFAFFGIIGGFLAPVLTSDSGGSHVLLFSYYALLNASILGIAWYRSWRELNLAGFFFTFVIGTLWGHEGYQPHHFASTEFFLILFYLFYLAIAVLFAHRQPLDLKGFIDGPLVFGLPLVVSGLQYYLVREIPYGMAYSALFFGVVYLLTATLLWRRLASQLRLLCESFLALGVVFGSLAIPLALDGHWSSAIWALEGAGMVWVGCRQRRLLARQFGVVLQLGAALIFLDTVWYPFQAIALFNRYFLGCFFLAVAAIFSAYTMDRESERLAPWEKLYPLPLLVLGVIWWYIGGMREIDQQIVATRQGSGFLLFSAMTAIIVMTLYLRLSWYRLLAVTLLHLPAMALLAVVGVFTKVLPSHLLAGWGVAAWILAFIVQYRLLYLCSELYGLRHRQIYHLGSLWLLLLVLSHEAAWLVHYFGLTGVWTFVCWCLVPTAGLLVILRLGRGDTWPAGRFTMYQSVAPLGPAVAIVVWIFLSCRVAGDPDPLPYVVFLNPVEICGLLGLGALLLLLLHIRGLLSEHYQHVARFGTLVVVLLTFIFLNAVVARGVHFYAGIPYTYHSLYNAAVFQAAIAACWGFGALVITVLAARSGSRAVWMGGAVLLAMTVGKLFLIDLSGTGTVARIVSFIVVGILMLVIGYFSPLPPKHKGTSA